MRETVFYAVDSYGLRGKDWRLSGGGPGGETLDEAYNRIKEDIDRIRQLGGFDPTKIKFIIRKTVSVETVEEEITGSDFTALMLKTA